MCEAPGTGMLRLDRAGRKLHGVVTCGCGERAIPISGAADDHPALGIDYEPLPNLRPAGLIGSEQAAPQHRPPGRP
ncbi:MAG: hypothetical protein E4H22_01260 [Solirubrobacterales bacterium]|nr:MAG: hypothetical protein E4H22_01260 [Solirubrobacterales bacterium]